MPTRCETADCHGEEDDGRGDGENCPLSPRGDRLALRAEIVAETKSKTRLQSEPMKPLKRRTGRGSASRTRPSIRPRREVRDLRAAITLPTQLVCTGWCQLACCETAETLPPTADCIKAGDAAAVVFPGMLARLLRPT